MAPITKLLVTPTDEHDAINAVSGGADIVDVKNPAEGSLGAALPTLIQKIRKIVPTNVLVSAALGDIPYLPGTVAQAALGAAVAGANYVKIGLWGTRKRDEAVDVLRAVVSTLKEFDTEVSPVAVLYADRDRVGTLDPMLLPGIAQEAKIGTVMVDTAIKDGKDLFHFMDQSSVRKLLIKCQNKGLETALAGSLSGESFQKAVKLKPNIVGVRSAVLVPNDRIEGRVDTDLVAELKTMLVGL